MCQDHVNELKHLMSQRKKLSCSLQLHKGIVVEAELFSSVSLVLV